MKKGKIVTVARVVSLLPSPGEGAQDTTSIAAMIILAEGLGPDRFDPVFRACGMALRCAQKKGLVIASDDGYWQRAPEA